MTKVYDLLEATIQAQEIIIKDLQNKDKLKNCEECYDKLSLALKLKELEVMAQPKTCDSCIYYISRFTPNGEVSYKFCTKEVNRASDKFFCVWHNWKVQP